MNHLQVFPKVAKCTYRNYGPSGTVQTIDAFCLLNHNIVNEKIYIILFVLFGVLLVVSVLACFYYTAVILIRPLRKRLLKTQTPRTPTKDVEMVSQHFDFDDMFVLRMLGHNINPLAFDELVSDLAAKLNKVDGIEV